MATCWIWFGVLVALVLTISLLSWFLLGSGDLSYNSLFFESGVLSSCQCCLGTKKGSRTPICRYPHSCPKIGFQLFAFSAETVPPYFGVFGPKIVFCPQATRKIVISDKFLLSTFALFAPPPPGARCKNGRNSPRCYTTSRAHLGPFQGGTRKRQVAATAEDKIDKAAGGSGFLSRELCPSPGKKGPPLVSMNCIHMAIDGAIGMHAYIYIYTHVYILKSQKTKTLCKFFKHYSKLKVTSWPKLKVTSWPKLKSSHTHTETKSKEEKKGEKRSVH